MGRKNYNSKDARRRHVVTYTPAEYSADYEVLMTNGSGVKLITVTGSRVSAWNMAIRIGLNQSDPTLVGVWWPIDMKRASENNALFSVV